VELNGDKVIVNGKELKDNDDEGDVTVPPPQGQGCLGI
jgi:hypothetical protein